MPVCVAGQAEFSRTPGETRSPPRAMLEQSPSSLSRRIFLPLVEGPGASALLSGAYSLSLSTRRRCGKYQEPRTPKGLRLGGHPTTPSHCHRSCLQGFPSLSLLRHFLLRTILLLFHPL